MSIVLSETQILDKAEVLTLKKFVNKSEFYQKLFKYLSLCLSYNCKSLICNPQVTTKELYEILNLSLELQKVFLSLNFSSSFNAYSIRRRWKGKKKDEEEKRWCILHNAMLYVKLMTYSPNIKYK